MCWSGVLPANAVVYLEAKDGSGLSELDPNSVAKEVRTHHWYPARGTTSYAYFNRRTWTARLGMGAEQEADALVGVTAEELPSVLRADVSASGTFDASAPGRLLGIRIDFETQDGFAESVLLHGGVCGPAAQQGEFPWGTEKPAGRVLPQDNPERLEIPLAKLAPSGWTGRAVISFRMRNTGPGTRAKIRLCPRN